MGWLNPFPRGARISQVFGSNPSNGVNPAGGHTGTDYAVPVGTPVLAAGDGVIELSSWTGDYASNPWWLTRYGGDSLVLNCGDNAPTFVYAHLLDSTAPVGAHVRRGDVIGYTGNSGTATTGPHCHVEALPPGYDLNSTTYGRVDPAAYLTDYPDGLAAHGTLEDILAKLDDDDRAYLRGLANEIIRTIWGTGEVTQKLIQGHGDAQLDVDVADLVKKVNDDAARRMAQ
jgi:hypothetical protein